jgi:Cellulase (glycosyl hydrolase family 5)
MGMIGATETWGSERDAAFTRMRRAGIKMVVTPISWPSVGPSGLQEPASWNSADPGDSHYNWSAVDDQVKALSSNGLEPILLVAEAPLWARLPPWDKVSAPEVAKFRQFMRAAAERYSGNYKGLPRVRYWQIWNEPNISLYFLPQILGGKLVSPELYRDLVNAAADSIHAVRGDNVVIAGSTAPFRDITPDVQAIDNDWGPLKFMQRLLCVDDAGKPTCGDTVSFDVWATHPYTSGGPTHRAALPYDVSLGDLSKMTRALRAAERAGHIKTASGRARFWVNEFSWDSKPPDKCSPPMSLLKRWIPESFYRMWANGVDMIAWFLLMDQPQTFSYYQSGLYFNASRLASAKPKPYFEAFRFPFVALRRGRGVYVWAHTPFGRRAAIVIQQTVKGRWKQVAKLRTDRYGIAQVVLKVKPAGQFRALLGGEKSLPFSMRVPPDHFYNPFGQATLFEPNAKPDCTP